MTSTLSGTVELKEKGRCFGQNSNAKSCPTILSFFLILPLLVVVDVLLLLLVSGRETGERLFNGTRLEKNQTIS